MMTRRAFAFAVGACICLVARASTGENPNKSTDRSAQVEELFQPWNRPDAPGVAVAIVHRGKVIFEKGFGRANLEYDIPIKPETVFHVASVSKQFTAMAVVLLEQDGKLSLEDEIHKFLPELPDYGRPITVRQLVQHTSGIRDQWSTLALAGWDLKDVITQDQILRLLFRQQELNFPPGDRMLYSNGGYTLLAEIVKRVSGQPLPEFCQERIFAPLGMSRTHFHLRLSDIVPHRAYSYAPRGKGFEISPLNYANVGATSLFTTAGDLALWLDNFRAPKVGTAKEVQRLAEQGILTSGKKIDYALGVVPGQYRGLRTLSHGGADAGYRSYVVWFPAQEFGVALASNHARFNGGPLANQIADLYLTADFTQPEPPPPRARPREAIALEPAAFDKFTGTYEFVEARGFAITYTRESDKFYAQATGQDKFEIYPESPAKFFYKVVDAQVTFVADTDGIVNRITHHQNGRDQAGRRVAAPTPDDVATLAKFAGHYWSEELETRYTFFVRDGRLVGLHARHGEFPLTHATANRFRTALWFMPNIEFQPDAAGEIIGAKLGGGRVLGVNFVRHSSSAARVTVVGGSNPPVP